MFVDNSLSIPEFSLRI